MVYVLSHIQLQRRGILLALMIALALVTGVSIAQTPPQQTTTPTLDTRVDDTTPSRLDRLYTDENGRVTASNDVEFMAQVAEESGSVAVIVQLNTRLQGIVPYDMLGETGKRQVVETVTQRVLALPQITDAKNVKTFTDFPLLALTVTPEGLEALRNSPHVVSITQDRLREPHLSKSTQLIGAKGAGGAWERGYTGVGQAIAILDSGVDPDHPFLQGKIVSEACYGTNETIMQGNTPILVSSNCPGGVTESTAPGSSINCNVPGDECIHGTHIAGVALGKGASFNGVAPDADLIAIQVFSRVDSLICQTPDYPYTSCIFALDSDVFKAMERVYQLRDQFDIAAVNMSFGGGDYTSEAFCDADNPEYFTLAQQLRNAGIATIASSGNRAYLNAMGAPACVSNIVSVAATGSDLSDNEVYLYSNTASFLDFLAPGYLVNSAVPGGGFGFASGTSVAAPHIAGAYALMRDYREGVDLDQIDEALKSTGLPIERIGSGTYIRPHVGNAIAWLVIPETPVLEAPANNITVNIPQITFSWTSGADTNEYRLRVFNEDGQRVVNEKVLHADCTEICSVTITTPLTDRQTHRWHVVAQNEQRESVSNEHTFYVDYPGAPELVSPEDNINFNRPADLTQLVWKPVQTATDYKVVVKDAKSGEKIVNAKVTSAICDAVACTYHVTGADQAGLRDDGVYKWHVVASNDLGKSKSIKHTFTTQFPAPPVLLSPVDGDVLSSPSLVGIFEWSMVSDVPEYKIVVKDNKNGTKVVKGVLQSASVCDAISETCTYIMSAAEKSQLKGSRKYVWTVQSRNALGKSKSLKWSFKTDFPGQPQLHAPADGIPLNDPSQLNLIQWTAVDEVTTYRLVIKDKTKGMKAVKVDLTVGVSVTCTAGICSYAPTLSDQAALKDNRVYVWKIQARNIYGKNNSPKRTFSTQFPGATTLYTPADKTEINSPSDLNTLTWKTNPYTDVYKLIVKDETGGSKIYKVDFPANNVNPICDASTCVFTVPNDLQSKLKGGRNYKWFVKTQNEHGTYKSNKLVFKARW